MTIKRLMSLFLLLALLAACGGGLSEEAPSAVGSERVGGPPLATPATEKVPVERVEVEGFSPATATGEMVVETVVEVAPGVGGEMRAGDTAAASTSSLSLEQTSRLTAGEVDDNAQWDDYLLYLRNYQGAAVIRVDVSERHQIVVQDSQGRPVLGARIAVQANGQDVQLLRTPSNGRALFFPRAFSQSAAAYDVIVTVNGQEQRFTIPASGSQREWIITHPGADQLVPQARLDVLFLIDATGSMGDEINQLKENIRAIAAQIEALPSRPDVRFAMVAYRDRGDEFLTRVTDFTPNVADFARELAALTADGGGDYPEDLNEGLSQAIHKVEWRVEETVSLIFLVADAPPHLDYGQENHYAAEMVQAAARGIKIYPIASSGLDSQGEYIFRQLAQFTGGRFIFLTYGAEGPGSTGTETTFNVSDYTVSSLDALVVRIIEEELVYLVR